MDGTEEYHNLIRGDSRAFGNVVKTLTMLKEYPNVEILIATAIMKQNINDLDNVKQLSKMMFPEYEQQIFLVSPVNGKDVSFTCSELLELKEKHPALFMDYFGISKMCFSFTKEHRCQGGVGNAVLTVDGIMKICPMAEEEIFILGDIKTSSFYDVWVNPNYMIKQFRREYVKSTPQCKKCKSKKKCGNKNCRLESFRLTGNCLNANPYTCMAVKGFYEEK